MTWLDLTKPSKELATWKTSITCERGIVRVQRHTLHPVHGKFIREDIVRKCDIVRVCVRYYELYVLELCQLFAADLYTELFEPTPL
jgi:hypothetical protein